MKIFPITTDALILAEFAVEYCGNRTVRGLDIGSGSGIISAEIAERREKVTMHGIELSEDAVTHARLEAERLGLGGRVTYERFDIRNRKQPATGKYDFAVANPPYFVSGRGREPKDAGIAVSRGEISAGIDDFCAAAETNVKNGGAFIIIMRAERIAEAFRSLNKAKFEPKRIKFVQKDANSPPKSVLIDARKNGKPPVVILPPLYIGSKY